MTGFWIDDGTKITCSVCGVDSRDFYPVCPHCRTTMDSKDKAVSVRVNFSKRSPVGKELAVIDIIGKSDDDDDER